MQTANKLETSAQAKQAILSQVVKPEFLRIFIKNYQNAKSPLHDAANEIKEAILALADSAELSSEKALELMQSFFGPNTERKLALRKNQDLLKTMASKFSSA